LVVYDVNCNSTFPTVCPDCDVLGAPVAVRFLPPLNTPTTGFVQLCEGDVLNLFNEVPFNINGAANYVVTWLDGSGAVIANPATVVPPVGFTPYCYEVSYCDNGACIETACLDVFVDPKPIVSTPTLGPICPGEAFDLTSVETSIATGGTINWSIGGIINSGGAAIANPSNVIPIGSELYCAEFTDNGTGCINTICASFTYEALPVLFTATATVCEGDALNLASLQPQITTTTGTFTWYNGDPTMGGTPVGSPAIVNPVNGDTYCAIFTDATTGCEASVCITPTVNAAPITTDYAPPAVCDSDAPYDLTQYQGSLGTGNFTWYSSNPIFGGLPINANAVNQTIGTTTYWFELTNPTTGCSTVSTIDLEVEQCCATVDLRIFFDGFPGQTSWDITDANGNVVASSGGTYGGQQGNTTLNINPVVCLADGCYDLNFYDAINNGMCPFKSSAFAQATFITPGTLITPGTIVGTLSLVTVPGLCGNYTLYDAAGTPLVNGGGAFGASETNNFCLSGGLAPRLASPESEVEKLIVPTTEIEVYPTITTDFVTVKFDNTTAESLSVINLDGKVFKTINVKAMNIGFTRINVQDLPNGLYFVQLRAGDGYSTGRFMKR